METIKLLEENISSRCLFKTLCEITNRGDILEKFNIEHLGHDTFVDVELTVNGVEVQFSEILKIFEGIFDEEIKIVAKEILKDKVFPNAEELTNKIYDFQRSLESLQETVDWNLSDYCRTLFSKEK